MVMLDYKPTELAYWKDGNGLAPPCARKRFLFTYLSWFLLAIEILRNNNSKLSYTKFILQKLITSIFIWCFEVNEKGINGSWDLTNIKSADMSYVHTYRQTADMHTANSVEVFQKKSDFKSPIHTLQARKEPWV